MNVNQLNKTRTQIGAQTGHKLRSSNILFIKDTLKNMEKLKVEI